MLDIGVIFDTKKFVEDPSSFNRQKLILKNVLNGYMIGPKQTLVGVVVNGVNPTIASYLNRYKDKSNLYNFIDSLNTLEQGYNINAALIKISDGIFSKRRNNALQTLILFRTHASEFDPLIADKMKRLDVKLLVVGVGPYIDAKELSGIAGKDGVVFIATNRNNDARIGTEVADKLRPSK